MITQMLHLEKFTELYIYVVHIFTTHMLHFSQKFTLKSSALSKMGYFANCNLALFSLPKDTINLFHKES